MKLIQMTPAQWADVQDNPIQRDTAKHAKKALRGHLRTASETHDLVAAALLPDGTMVKLDGHTRCLLWSDGRLDAPATVHVAVHSVQSMAGAIKLYKEYDNPGATENAGDRLSGAYRLHQITPKSGLLTQGGITSAMTIIAPGKTVYAMVSEWKSELELLDELDTTHNAMPSTLICAALLTLRRHGAAALDFWRLYAAGGGTRIDGKSCGVDELTRIVADLRARKQLASGGPSGRQAQAGRAISCCDAWLQGRNYAHAAKTTSLKGYLEGLKSKGRNSPTATIKSRNKDAA